MHALGMVMESELRAGLKEHSDLVTLIIDDRDRMVHPKLAVQHLSAQHAVARTKSRPGYHLHRPAPPATDARMQPP